MKIERNFTNLSELFCDGWDSFSRLSSIFGFDSRFLFAVDSGGPFVVRLLAAVATTSLWASRQTSRTHRTPNHRQCPRPHRNISQWVPTSCLVNEFDQRVRFIVSYFFRVFLHVSSLIWFNYVLKFFTSHFCAPCVLLREIQFSHLRNGSGRPIMLCAMNS